jgi:hypothetical protein
VQPLFSINLFIMSTGLNPSFACQGFLPLCSQGRASPAPGCCRGDSTTAPRLLLGVRQQRRQRRAVPQRRRGSPLLRRLPQPQRRRCRRVHRRQCNTSGVTQGFHLRLHKPSPSSHVVEIEQSTPNLELKVLSKCNPS